MPTHHLLSGFSLWGLEGLHDPPLSGIPAVKDAGYTTLEVGYFNVQPPVVQAVKANGLRLIVQRRATSVEDLVGALVAARRHDALLVNAHAGTPHMNHDDSVGLINAMINTAEEHGMRLLFETHRGQLTQDIFRTLELVQAVPRMRLTLDVSHYIVAGEQPGPTEDLMPLLRELLPRVEMIHGRISNGQQIQVDVGDGTGELPQLYKQLWTEAMRNWRQRNAPGSVFVFTPELGPPPYALSNAEGREFSDRWEQSLVIGRLAEEAWKASALPA